MAASGEYPSLPAAARSAAPAALAALGLLAAGCGPAAIRGLPEALRFDPRPNLPVQVQARRVVGGGGEAALGAPRIPMDEPFEAVVMGLRVSGRPPRERVELDLQPTYDRALRITLRLPAPDERWMRLGRGDEVRVRLLGPPPHGRVVERAVTASVVRENPPYRLFVLHGRDSLAEPFPASLRVVGGRRAVSRAATTGAELCETSLERFGFEVFVEGGEEHRMLPGSKLVLEGEGPLHTLVEARDCVRLVRSSCTGVRAGTRDCQAVVVVAPPPPERGVGSR